MTTARTLGDGRYVVIRRLGAGGMGVVYEALDNERQDRIALKSLPRVEPDALARFKNEFRHLADITHPNLASLYELFSDGDQWFFTMELVYGVDFHDYVRVGRFESSPLVAISSESSPTMERSSEGIDGSAKGAGDTFAAASPDAAKIAVSPERGVRLRPALRQLVEAVAALHAAGKLHCDIKPSNVLVTPEGRVVLLDFGLATDLVQAKGREQETGGGTARYMSPEQAEGGPLTPASDWYAVGTLLFEALTDRMPFRGPTPEVLRAKRERDGPAPSTLAAGVPDDLDQLCQDLLKRSPEARPRGDQILERVGGSAEAAFTPLLAESLVGRTGHLAQLRSALEAAERGSAVTVHVRGESGAGKSFLVQRFLASLEEDEQAVVLSGRCYEGESVPYKALDNVVDGLSNFLASVSDQEAALLMPRDIHALARVFPVLGRVPAVAGAPRRAGEVPDRLELRRRAFAAFRELLARIGDRRPLVLSIDDLHWGDADSAALLGDLLRPPDPPRLLLVAVYRSDNLETSPFLRSFLAARSESTLAHREIVVESLEFEDALALARDLLAHEGALDAALAERIATESRGVPYFVHELVRYLGGGDGRSRDVEAAATLTLDSVLSRRLATLGHGSRQLLETIAVSAVPLTQRDACEAAGLRSEPRRALATLRAGHLVKTTGPSDRDLVETYHDRIRELVTDALTQDARRACHLRLAVTLEASERADPEALGVHLEGAGELERAGRYYAAAGQRASEALAFDRAARLLRRSLELHPLEGAAGAMLRAKLGDALANAGRGLDAAREYDRARGGLGASEAFELQTKAAYQYCISGHLDEGRAALRDLLGRVGLRMPRTRRGTIALLLGNRLRLKLRGIHHLRRDAREVPEEVLRRTDVTWTASAGLSMFDTVAGTAFQARNVLDALESGEPLRVVRALAWEAVVGANSGPRALPRALGLLGAARALAGETQEPYALGMCRLAGGVVEFLMGNWQAACPLLDEAEEIFRSRCTGVTWETNTANSFNMWALVHRGEFAAMSRRSAILLKEANERGDRSASTTMESFMVAHSHLMNDDPAAARGAVDGALARFAVQGYQLQHINALWMRSYIDFYDGAGREALERIEREWAGVKQSFLLRSLVIRSFFRYIKARAALDAQPITPALGHATERAASQLDAEKVSWTAAFGLLLRAGLEMRRGNGEAAVERLAAAEAGLTAAGMAGFAASARRQRGELRGGSEGAALVEEADTWMRGQGIRNPAAMVRLHVPSRAPTP